MLLWPFFIPGLSRAFLRQEQSFGCEFVVRISRLSLARAPVR